MKTIKTFVVLNEANHSASSYHEIEGVFPSESAAKACIESRISDLTKYIENGDIGPEFNEYEIHHDEDCVYGNTAEVVSKANDFLYEAWSIEEFSMNIED